MTTFTQSMMRPSSWNFDSIDIQPSPSPAPQSFSFLNQSFLDSSDDAHTKDHLSAESGNLQDADHFNHYFRSYSLRESVRNCKGVYITWLDTDTSGTYDPTKPDTKKNQTISRVRSDSTHHDLSPTSGDDDNLEPRGAQLSRLAARQSGASIVVTLSFTSPAIKDLVRKIPDNWPGAEGHNILSDEHFKKLADQIINGTEYWRKYSLRKRASNIAPDLELPEGCIPDPAGIEIDLKGHPAARGCKACRQLQVACPLLDDWADTEAWPCKLCTEDNVHCELITPPIRRATCDDCRRKKMKCSYNYDAHSDPALPCTQCADKEVRCIAGPAASDGIRERISYDRDYSNPIPQRQRRFVTCTTCREAKKSCSLRRKTDDPPCASCEDEGIECTFLPIKNKRKALRFASLPLSSSSRPSQQPTSGRTPANAITIRTSLGHPITFLHDDPDKCDWCVNSVGVLGLGWADVTVIPSEGDISYTEISGGHNTRGDEPTTMCATCTMLRCRIIGCNEHHEMRPLDGLSIGTRVDDVDQTERLTLQDFDIDAMYTRLVDRNCLLSDKWCALCPSPALYQCCTPQEDDMWGDAIQDPLSDDAEGCGLVLCEDCAVCYDEFGNLEEVIETIERDQDAQDIWILGIRADTEFLKVGGLLHRNINAMGGDEEMNLAG